MASEKETQILSNIVLNRIIAIISIVGSCCGAMIWSTKQVQTIITAIHDNTKETHDNTDKLRQLESSQKEDHEKVIVLWNTKNKQQ